MHPFLLPNALGQNQRINHKYEYEYKINTCNGCTNVQKIPSPAAATAVTGRPR